MGIFKGSRALALLLNRRPRGFPEQAKFKWEIKYPPACRGVFYFSKDEAIKFVAQLMQDIFSDKKVELLDKYYMNELVGHYDEEVITLDDIRNRVNTLKMNTKNFRSNVENVCVIDDLIFFHVKQNWISTENNQLHDSIVFGVYRIKNKKVCELWCLLDKEISSYKEANRDFQKEMQPFELEEKTKHEFLRKLAIMKKENLTNTSELTSVEEECLYYYFHGFSAKETAIKMNISFRTVQVYTTRAYFSESRINKTPHLEI